MKIVIDNRQNLVTVLPRCKFRKSSLEWDKEISKWIYNELCGSQSNFNYFWHVWKIEFDTEEEAQSFIVLKKLEEGL